MIISARGTRPTAKFMEQPAVVEGHCGTGSAAHPIARAADPSNTNLNTNCENRELGSVNGYVPVASLFLK
jgi:hypothetical protein